MVNKNEIEIKEEQMTEFLSGMLSKVEHEADPDELARLKRVFKKCIPLGRRSYVAAYITKLLLSDESSKSRFLHNKQRNDEHFKRGERTEKPKTEVKEHSERPARIVIDESLSATIFIGIGRNRHVFPRDLVGLVANVAGIEKERIGTIKVLANYSFVQLFKEDAEKVIAALNGYDYRGRKLNVSYSKQRSDSASEEDAIEEQAPDSEISTENAQEQTQTQE